MVLEELNKDHQTRSDLWNKKMWWKISKNLEKVCKNYFTVKSINNKYFISFILYLYYVFIMALY